MIGLDSELLRIHALRRWQARLQEVESVFARLVYVSSLLASSGRYAEPYLNQVFPPGACHRLLADVHRQVFREWLSLSLKCKIRDLQLYSEAICQPHAEASDLEWIRFCNGLVPSGITIAELTLFSGTTRRIARVIRES